jgi:phosphoribosyl 1,2-cyclic phosphodiesterase
MIYPPQPEKSNGRLAAEIVFLRTGGAIQIPASFRSCEVCQTARGEPKHCRTRASLALIGQVITIIDASPDLEFQLECEGIIASGGR